MFFWFIFLFISVHNLLCIEEKKIVIISCCYNAAPTIQKTLDSIFLQEYNNFRVVLVNDASTDETKTLIDSYLETIQKTNRTSPCQVQHNTIRQRKLANLYTALHACDPDEIVFLLDGDDWLSNNQVLARINQYYDDPSIWMTFGNYQNYPAHITKKWGVAEKSYCSKVPDNIIDQLLYRKKPFVYMHPRTFYAWLFHQVRLADLITERISTFAGDFFPACNDLAMFFPMVELAGTHVQFINEILYIRNVESNFVGFKVDSLLQRQAAYEIRRKKSYQPLFDRPQGKHVSYRDIIYITDNVLLTRHKLDQFKTIGKIKQCSTEQSIASLAKIFRYCAIVQQKNSIIHDIDLEKVILILEKTKCPFCLFKEKPGTSLALTHSVFVWKRSLNVYLPRVTECIVSLTDLLDFVQQKNYDSILQACNAYIQSFHYDAALSFI